MEEEAEDEGGEVVGEEEGEEDVGGKEVGGVSGYSAGAETTAGVGPAQKDGEDGGEGEEERTERGLSEPLFEAIKDIVVRFR